MKNLPAATNAIIKNFSIVLFLCLASLAITACEKKQEDFFQGYVEGEYLHISSPIGGRLEQLHVTRGMTVAENAPLFQLERTVEIADVAEAEQMLQRAENTLADITKGLRQPEIEVIIARLEQAQASYDLASKEFERRKKLLEQKVIAEAILDQTRTEMERSAALIAQLQAELETARLGARPDAIKAAGTEVNAARERLVQARWRLDQKTQNAPQGGLVFDTFYEPGEYVPLTHPVVSILPPGNVKIRFFVPEPMVGTLEIGQDISIRFDGAPKTYPAEISFISPQPEYTPPVIYSRKTRSHLVFMVEAKVSSEDGAALHPGQPVDVYPEPPNG